MILINPKFSFAICPPREIGAEKSLEQGGYHEAAPRQIRTAISAKSKMLKIKIISVGRIKQKGWQAAESEYSQRIMRYAKLEHVFVKDAFLGSIRNAKKVMTHEADSILSKIKKNEFTVALDRQGEQMSSQEFAGFLSFKTLHGVSKITFVVGGPLGLAEEFLKKVDLILSLSQMTLPHELSKVILLEQIYRAFSILKNEKYHK